MIEGGESVSPSATFWLFYPLILKELSPQEPMQPGMLSSEIVAANRLPAAPMRTLIHGLPNETLFQILKFVCGDEIPSRTIALVCKLWKSTILETPMFWRKVEARILWDCNTSAYVVMMRRRLELSGNVLLDVTLSIDEGNLITANDGLFWILAEVDVKRWRSLKVIDDFASGRYFTEVFDKFTGAFSSLTTLHLHSLRGSRVFSSIYRLLAQSAIEVRSLHVEGELPDELHSPFFLKNIRHVASSEHLYGLIRTHAELERVTLVTVNEGYPAIISSKPLPRLVTFLSLPRHMISRFDYSQVQSLEIRCFTQPTPHDTPVHMPCLISLSLPCRVSLFQRINAPALESFRTYRSKGLSLQGWTQESKRTIEICKEDPSAILFTPIFLDMDVFISTKAILAVLSHWPQVQHLSLNLSEHFNWKGAFSSSFTKRKGMICPNMVTLKLRTRWNESESKTWEETARDMLKLRQAGALTLISWTHGRGGKEHSFISRDDIFGGPSYANVS